MCLLVVQHNNPKEQKSTQFTKEMFENVWESNPHGFGLGWFRKGNPELFHSTKMDEAWAAYQEHYKRFEGEMIIHWRWATQGLKDETNCHPFLTDTKPPCILGHNGVISPVAPACDKDWSDTRWFANSFQSLFPKPDIIGHVDNEKDMKFYIGGSRIAIIEPNNRLHTWNFPTQTKDTKEYGLFSATGVRRRVYHAYQSYSDRDDNWGPFRQAYKDRKNASPDYRERKKKYTDPKYISTRSLDKETFLLPQTFWLFEVLETNAWTDFELVMRQFHNRFDRFPTCQEITGAFALTTKNRDMKPKSITEPDVPQGELLHGL